MITEIWLQKWEDYTSEKKTDSLELGRMNVFIGRNNSGKSRLLRALYSSDKADFYYKLDSDDLVYYKEFLNILSHHLTPNHILNNIHGPQLSEIAEKKISVFSNEQRNLLNKVPKTYEMLKDKAANSNAQGNMNDGEKAALRKDLDRYHNANSHLKIEDLELTTAIPDIRYIPTLRGMRPVASTEKNAYKNRTVSDYFDSTPTIIKNIHTGEVLYDLLRKNLLGEPHERKIVSDYENALSAAFFEGQPVTLIPRHDADVVCVKIGDEEQRPIHDLGDGLQSIIIITSTAYLTETESIILIEEPEHHLHPGMLRQLTLFLLEKTPHQHQYFVTSHSNHLLEFADERDDVRIHKVAKKLINEKVTFNISDVVRDRELLLDLGVKSSSLYLANCTLWVEGITDRLYLRAYLKKYISSLEHTDKYTLYKNYTENYHYAFVEYQGGNLVHWEFDDDDDEEEDGDKLEARLTTSHIFLIADGDIKEKNDRVEQLKAQLGNQFYLLKGKEIENLIPVEILTKTAKKIFVSTRQTHEKNIGNIDSLTYDEYADSEHGIGYHLDQKLGLTEDEVDEKGNKKRIFAASSGTLEKKRLFCTHATKFMNTPSDDWELTPQITELCEKILGHIEQSNELE